MMKARFLCLIALLWATPTLLKAQDYPLYWKYKDYDGVALTVPRSLFGMASWFLDELSEREALRAVHRVRVMFFEGGSPIKDRDMRKFERRARRRHLEDVVLVRHGKEQVRVMAKERRGALRKVVVLARTEEEFVFVSLKGSIYLEDINRLLQKAPKKKDKKGGNIEVPTIFKT